MFCLGCITANFFVCHKKKKRGRKECWKGEREEGREKEKVIAHERKNIKWNKHRIR